MYEVMECASDMRTAKRRRSDMAEESPQPTTEDQDGFTQVGGRGGKRPALTNSPIQGSPPTHTNTNQHNQINIPQIVLNIYIKGKDIDITKINPLKIKTDIDRVVRGTVEKITLAGNCLRVTCSSQAQYQALLGCKTLAERLVECTEPRTRAHTAAAKLKKITIFGVPLDITPEELVEVSGAMFATRRMRREGGVLTPTNAVILSYKQEDADPSHIKILYTSYKTRIYIPPPTRCNRCQLFGHQGANCRQSAPSCPICAGPHTYDMCAQKDGPRKCSNCGGGHSSAYTKCPKFIQSQEITKIVITTGISYRDALIRVKTIQPVMASPPTQLITKFITPLIQPHPPVARPPPQTGSAPALCLATKFAQTDLQIPGRIKSVKIVETQTEWGGRGSTGVKYIVPTPRANASPFLLIHTGEISAPIVPTVVPLTLLDTLRVEKIVKNPITISTEDVCDFFKNLTKALNTRGTDRKVCGRAVWEDATKLFKFGDHDFRVLKIGIPTAIQPTKIPNKQTPQNH